MTSPNASRDDFDRLMSRWMEADGRIREPEDLVERVIEQATATRQISRWLLPERWLPMQLTTRFQTVPRLAPALLLALLLLAVVAAIVIVGSQPKIPPPFGPAANGFIAYDTKDAIFVADQGGADVRPLIEGVVTASSPAWSPDGTRIAFWGNGSPDSLFIADANGNGVREVASRVWISTDKPPTWSPDGRFIAFSSESGPDMEGERLFVVEIETGVVTRVGADGPIDVRSIFPSWSPDGNWIAFLGVPLAVGGDMGLWVVRPNGLEPHRLPTSPAVELAQPQWAPSADPLRLVYAALNATRSHRDIYMLDVATDVETMIFSGPYDNAGPTWSPDGTRLAWLVFGGSSQLRIASIASPATATVVSSDGMTTPLAWSPDGTKIFGSDPAQTHVLVVTVDGSSPTVRINHDQAQGWPAWQRLAP